MDTCAGLFLRPLRCGSPPPRPACQARWPPGLLRNQTVAPAQCTAFCKRKHNFVTLLDALHKLKNIQRWPKKKKIKSQLNVRYTWGKWHILYYYMQSQDHTVWESCQFQTTYARNYFRYHGYGNVLPIYSVSLSHQGSPQYTLQSKSKWNGFITPF